MIQVKLASDLEVEFVEIVSENPYQSNRGSEETSEVYVL